MDDIAYLIAEIFGFSSGTNKKVNKKHAFLYTVLFVIFILAIIYSIYTHTG